MIKVAYICGGCGKRIEARTADELGPFPIGWFSATNADQPLACRDLMSTIAACSADCIESAKDKAKRYWADWSVRQQAIIDRAVFRRSE